MNRTILMIAALLGASGLPLALLVDSAVKGTALLALAGVAAVLLRRDSAAARHLVWLLALVAMLLLPVLSAVLPRWRVLPGWAGVSPGPVVANPSAAPSLARAIDSANIEPPPRPAEPVDVERRPPAIALQPQAVPQHLPPTSATPRIVAAAPASAVSRNWLHALPLAWAIGFCALVLRLAAARCVLWDSERRGTVIPSRRRPAEATHDPIVTALHAARSQLGIHRPVTLLIHPDKAIPVVWGVFRSRLMLPAAAREWTAEQLRSVLLHELAHVGRRDTIAQLLAQVACALHWFNPLVWLAAWRLSVERERACDDLVLAGGVRASAYAGHLLDVVTALAPARGIQSCGLAMARRSSLEGRLAAVLSGNRNRRGVSVALAIMALVIAAGLAVPVAMLHAADDKPAADSLTRPATAATTKPTTAEKTMAGAEDNLKWGDPVNGLRAAIAIRQSSDKPEPGDLPDLYLAVQNVSKAPLRLTDADVPRDVSDRTLYPKIDGRIVYAMGAREPAIGDLTIRPGGVAFVPMFDPVKKFTVPADPSLDKHTLGSHIAETAIKDAHQTLSAELQIDKAPAGAWTGKLRTGETSGPAAAGHAQPKDKRAQALFDLWLLEARLNGDIPGGLVGLLGDRVKEFIRNNTNQPGGAAYARKMAPLVDRFDASHDWSPADASALLDAVAAAHTIPLEMAAWDLGNLTIRTGTPLPKPLADAPWGEPKAGGLRLAWLLEPRAPQHPLGTPLKSRILIHNSGKDTVVFRGQSWNQSGGHKATDANGAEIKIDSTEWTTLSRLETFRLAPGEFVELDAAAGIGVGERKTIRHEDDRPDIRVGAWIDAKVGDDVTFTPDAVLLGEGNEPPAPAEGPPGWWPAFISARLSRDLPLPAGADERNRLLDRAMLDLFGTSPTAEERAAIVAAGGPKAVDALAQRLARRPGLTAFSGPLKSGPTKFRVLPPDPDAAKKPRTASAPGQYTLGGNATLVITRRPAGERIVNEAHLAFSPPPGQVPPRSHEVQLPDGYATWAAAWMRGATELWVMDKGRVRSFNFANPAEVKETTLAGPANFDKVPKPILDALQAALPAPEAPAAPGGRSAAPATEAPK